MPVTRLPVCSPIQPRPGPIGRIGGRLWLALVLVGCGCAPGAAPVPAESVPLAAPIARSTWSEWWDWPTVLLVAWFLGLLLPGLADFVRREWKP